MKSNLTSATKSYERLSKALQLIAPALNQTNQSFMLFANRLSEMRYNKCIEQERIFYLKEIQNYTGYKITSFLDIKNV